MPTDPQKINVWVANSYVPVMCKSSLAGRCDIVISDIVICDQMALISGHDRVLTPVKCVLRTQAERCILFSWDMLPTSLKTLLVIPARQTAQPLYIYWTFKTGSFGTFTEACLQSTVKHSTVCKVWLTPGSSCGVIQVSNSCCSWLTFAWAVQSVRCTASAKLWLQIWWRKECYLQCPYKYGKRCNWSTPVYLELVTSGPYWLAANM